MNVIYFDWDGTLADSMGLCVAEMTETFRLMGLPQKTEAEYKRCNGPTPPDSAPMMGIPPERTEEYLTIRRRVGYEMVEKHQKLFPGIKAMLKELSQKASLVIVSNGNDAYIRRSAEICGVSSCFERIQASVPSKNKTELLAGLISDMKPERAVMVGDMRGDFIAGQGNGLLTVCADWGYGSTEERALADIHAGTAEELESWLKAWLNRE